MYKDMLMEQRKVWMDFIYACLHYARTCNDKEDRLERVVRIGCFYDKVVGEEFNAYGVWMFENLFEETTRPYWADGDLDEFNELANLLGSIRGRSIELGLEG